jgi:hypothetical protein
VENTAHPTAPRIAENDAPCLGIQMHKYCNPGRTRLVRSAITIRKGDQPIFHAAIDGLPPTIKRSPQQVGIILNSALTEGQVIVWMSFSPEEALQFAAELIQQACLAMRSGEAPPSQE